MRQVDEKYVLMVNEAERSITTPLTGMVMDSNSHHSSMKEEDLAAIGHRIVWFTAMLATALALGAALAHAFELPNKMALGREDYFTVQQIYAGWNRLAYLLGVQLIALVALAVISRHQLGVRGGALVAIAGLIGAQVIFWSWTFPANVATESWTVIPTNWQALRKTWEYSHAAGAALQTIAMSALIVAATARSR